MKLENEFVVPASVEQAWDVMLDIERIAPCLPGATVEKSDDGAYEGTMTVKLGPIVNRYKGTLEIKESDEAAHRAVLSAKAREARGQGTAAATITSVLETVDDGTRVRVETDIRITGPAAQFGRGVMQDVSAKLMRDFADCLAQRMAAPAAAGEAEPTADEAGAATGGAGPAGAGGPTAGEAAAAGGPAAGEAAGAGGSATGDAGAGGPAAGEAAGAGGPETGEATGAGGPAAGEAAAAGGPAGAGAADEPRAAEVLDLGAASREAVLKRVAPIAAGVVALLVLLRLRRRRR